MSRSHLLRSLVLSLFAALALGGTSRAQMPPGGAGHKVLNVPWASVPGEAFGIAAGRDVFVLGNPSWGPLHAIWKWEANKWVRMQNTAAREIAAGADGSVWHLGAESMPGGYAIYVWKDNQWMWVPGGLVHLAVAADGTVWGVNSAGVIFRSLSVPQQPPPPSACAANPCDSHAVCLNTKEGYSCRCLAGFNGDGKHCVETDACAANPCDKNAKCVKTGPGAFYCECPAGYESAGNHCVEQNPCEKNPCSPNAVCTRTSGTTFHCTCKVGYQGDGMSCTASGGPK